MRCYVVIGQFGGEKMSTGVSTKVTAATLGTAVASVLMVIAAHFWPGQFSVTEIAALTAGVATMVTFVAGLVTVDPIRREGRLHLERKTARTEKLMSDIQAHLDAAAGRDEALAGMQAELTADTTALHGLQETVNRYHP
jgi:hypothetical protein